MKVSKAYQRERWRRCADYIARAGDVPAAMRLAKKDGFSANTSVWISALGKLLEQVMKIDLAKKKKAKKK